VIRPLLEATARHAATFLESLDERRVQPSIGVDELRARLNGPLPDGPTDPARVIDDLVAAADPGVVAIPSGRYFGFVIGGGVPAALAADWLTSTWDQNAGLYVGGPSASVVEDVAGEWLKELLGLPPAASYAFVTGCQTAHVTALAAARQHLLAQRGWDLARDGLYGAPRIRVIAGDDRHVTVDRALRLLGMGAPVTVGSDGQGRLDPQGLSAVLDDSVPTIVCAQAGNVNTGAVDDLVAIAAQTRRAGAWLHIDGAFGMWAAASLRLRHLVEGVDQADSWATDCHKWLNVPYDSGLAFVARPDAHRAALGTRASYLVQSKGDRERDQMDWTPEFSRRARGFAVYAAIRSLGRSGIAELVERCCAHARHFAEELGRAPGVEVLNEIVLNQVLVRFDDGRTPRVIERVQEDGTCFVSGTSWRGEPAMRISVSNWQTSDADVERSLAAILAAAR
jgi:glutamate/tyrosine decarboxylase-like PLP-dependent enzyme